VSEFIAQLEGEVPNWKKVKELQNQTGLLQTGFIGEDILTEL
jgi:hypothetical protein